MMVIRLCCDDETWLAGWRGSTEALLRHRVVMRSVARIIQPDDNPTASSVVVVPAVAKYSLSLNRSCTLRAILLAPNAKVRYTCRSSTLFLETHRTRSSPSLPTTNNATLPILRPASWPLCPMVLSYGRASRIVPSHMLTSAFAATRMWNLGDFGSV